MTAGETKRAYWIVTAPCVLVTMTAGTAFLLDFVAKVAGIIHLGGLGYICTLLGVTKLLGATFAGVVLPVVVLGFFLTSYTVQGTFLIEGKTNMETFMDTFLAPIEKPKGLMMKLAYYFTRKQFGKVLTPLKVHSARMPAAFGMFYSKISGLDKKLTLAPELVMLIREQVSRINVCLFCLDIGRSFTIKASMNQAKFDALEEYRASVLFTEAERAALDYVTELTKNKKVDSVVFTRLARYYSEREICEIVWLVASEHVYNLTNIGLNIHSDMLCDITKMKRS